MEFGIQYDLVPSRTALVNVDLQEAFVEGYPLSAVDGPGVLERVNGLTAKCRPAGIVVVHTRYVLRPDGSNLGVAAAQMPPVKEGLFNEGNKAADLHSKLVVERGDIVLDKPLLGAFHGTDLDLILRSRGIDTVIVCGITTNFCCDTTAREAAARNYKVFFLSDGCSTCDLPGMSAAELHKATLTNLGFALAHVLTVDAMIDKIGAAAH